MPRLATIGAAADLPGMPRQATIGAAADLGWSIPGATRKPRAPASTS